MLLAGFYYIFLVAFLKLIVAWKTLFPSPQTQVRMKQIQQKGPLNTKISFLFYEGQRH